MKKLFPLVLCLSLSFFTVARASRPAHAFAPETGAKALVNDANADEEVTSDDDDSTEGASNDEGEDMNDDDADAAGDEDTGDDGGGDDAGDEGGDEGK